MYMVCIKVITQNYYLFMDTLIDFVILFSYYDNKPCNDIN